MAPVTGPDRRPIVLVVDDNDKVRAALVEILGDLDADVVATAGEADAVAEAEGRHVDLLLTDLVLGPGSSGIDLARTLRSGRPDLAVIVLSAYDASQVDLSGLGEDIEFWSKPADIDRLATRLDELRRNRQVR